MSEPLGRHSPRRDPNGSSPRSPRRRTEPDLRRSQHSKGEPRGGRDQHPLAIERMRPPPDPPASVVRLRDPATTPPSRSTTPSCDLSTSTTHHSSSRLYALWRQPTSHRDSRSMGAPPPPRPGAPRLNQPMHTSDAETSHASPDAAACPPREGGRTADRSRTAPRCGATAWRYRPRWRAMTMRCTSFVPSPISRIFWSR